MEQEVANASPDEVRCVIGVLETVEYLQGVRIDVPSRQVVLGARNDDGVHERMITNLSPKSLLLIVVLLAQPTFAAAQGPTGPADSALARARTLYNEERYDAAIASAVLARQATVTADSAALVLARAYLERFRRSAIAADLVAARTALAELRVSALKPRERVEYLIGLGESLFLEEAYGAAAELFESAMGRAAEVGVRAHERVLDWWASALERQAALRSFDERTAAYRRLVDRMTTELERDPGSGAAAYWIAAASRGVGDFERAWQAAIAGWVRAALTPDGGVALRADLDRLVTQAIIPDRVRRLPATEREAAAAVLRAEWETMKGKWAGK